MPLFRKYFEPVAWIVALVILYQPGVIAGRFTVCVFHFFGFESCPGCGLGLSIYHALHLDVENSIKEHILGIPVMFALLTVILKKILPPNKSSQHL